MNLIKKLIFRFSKEYCFDQMIKCGSITENKKCGGMVGGDRQSNYLSYSCVDCKYFDKSLFKQGEI